MIKNELISKLNDQRLSNYLNYPVVPLIIYGDKYLYKDKIISFLAQKILSLDDQEFKRYPYILRIKAIDNKIGIDQIKGINKFIELKVPVDKDINRIILIHNSDKMTIEAQNAFLKNLEEPPQRTLFILSTNNLNSLLSTIKSRCIKIRIIKPSEDEIINHYTELGYKLEDIKKAINVSNSLPKLLYKILTNKNSNIDEQISIAKVILSNDQFNRLKMVDTLVKDKDKVKDIFYIIKQMSKFGLLSKSYQDSIKWLKILNKTLLAEEDLENQVHLKTLLSDYLLNI